MVAPRTRVGAGGRSLLVLPGSHLFESSLHRRDGADLVFMAEDPDLCTRVRHHRQKIVLFLAAMRHHRDALRAAGRTVDYHELDWSRLNRRADARIDERGSGADGFMLRLRASIRRHRIDEIRHWEIEDRFFDRALGELVRSMGVRRRVLESPMFLTAESQRREYLEQQGVTEDGCGARASMAHFYRWQRRRLGVLLEDDGTPTGGRWSFDVLNRRRLPADLQIPPPMPATPSSHVRALLPLVEASFPGHPGDLQHFDWPVERATARSWLDDFIQARLGSFGPYEDFMSRRSAVLFHSRLSPMLNMGLLTPREVIDAAIDAWRGRGGRGAGADEPPILIESVEGFVRQVLGWREFVRMIDGHLGARQAQRNIFGHHRHPTAAWWSGGSGLPMLDAMIARLHSTGWVHHIERLMLAGNLMTLCEIEPSEAHRWFMEMFIDSADWVMGPNVFGMGIWSDGGLFATKPYLCGSNYLRRMSDEPAGEWCDAIDGLYWRFIARHRKLLGGHPRMRTIVRSLERLDPARVRRREAAAEALLGRMSTE